MCDGLFASSRAPPTSIKVPSEKRNGGRGGSALAPPSGRSGAPVWAAAAGTRVRTPPLARCGPRRWRGPHLISANVGETPRLSAGLSVDLGGSRGLAAPSSSAHAVFTSRVSSHERTQLKRCSRCSPPTEPSELTGGNDAAAAAVPAVAAAAAAAAAAAPPASEPPAEPSEVAAPSAPPGARAGRLAALGSAFTKPRLWQPGRAPTERSLAACAPPSPLPPSSPLPSPLPSLPLSPSPPRARRWRVRIRTSTCLSPGRSMSAASRSSRASHIRPRRTSATARR